ncbi:hypothetical protein [Desulfosporosinus hippei]|uniref:Uncharacterized protein n=1 Tax=Desulfosporosinus hippei DSM 8344 TaxID=1121419 RepID=A0A1G8FE06_9FIRM|nr:hypothetical protein [Desulfosporosinus hippei]SDH80360.1 hypothetical protein SAMN05443529_11961 [Desulfosporosinus hippei DSM 8344]
MIGKLRMYGVFTRKSFQRAAAYRFDAWTRILGNVMMLFMWGFVWYALYHGKRVNRKCNLPFDVELYLSKPSPSGNSWTQ